MFVCEQGRQLELHSTLSRSTTQCGHRCQPIAVPVKIRRPPRPSRIPPPLLHLAEDGSSSPHHRAHEGGRLNRRHGSHAMRGSESRRGCWWSVHLAHVVLLQVYVARPGGTTHARHHPSFTELRDERERHRYKTVKALQLGIEESECLAKEKGAAATKVTWS